MYDGKSNRKSTVSLRKDTCQMSKSNKLIIFLYLIALTIVVFVHYPFGKYHSTKQISVFRGEGECPKAKSVEELKAMTVDQLRQSTSCRREYSETVDLPMLEWRSEEPILDWFYSLSHVLSFVALLTTVAAISSLFFKSPSSNSTQTET